MNIAQKIDPVIDHLGRVLNEGHLPHPYDRWGARLLNHLTRPVQIVVTGFAGTGKTALIEMMSRRVVLDHDARASVIELAYGDTEQVIIERADGSVTSIVGTLKTCSCPSDAHRIRQELPDENLLANDFIEMGLRGDMAEKRAGLEAVIERADLVLWCSQEFGEDEQELWSAVPDNIKDHSLLILTKADQQLMRGVIEETIVRLDPIVAEEFLGLYPVATIQGITAQTGSDTVNESLWASSGGKQLMDVLARQVRQGRNADYDQARVFMERLAMRMPVTIVPSTGIFSETPGETEPDATPIEASMPNTGGALDLETDTEALTKLSEAIDLLQAQSLRMLDEMDDMDEVDPDRILSDCTDAIRSVSNILQSPPQGGPLQGAVQDDIQDGEEMLMLFQLERGEDAALDAVTLMLQIRKELSQKLAG